MKNVTAIIPARIGSQRLKYKNLALLNGKPIIYYAINAAKKSLELAQKAGNDDYVALNTKSLKEWGAM